MALGGYTSFPRTTPSRSYSVDSSSHQNQPMVQDSFPWLSCSGGVPGATQPVVNNGQSSAMENVHNKLTSRGRYLVRLQKQKQTPHDDMHKNSNINQQQHNNKYLLHKTRSFRLPNRRRYTLNGHSHNFINRK